MRQLQPGMGGCALSVCLPGEDLSQVFRAFPACGSGNRRVRRMRRQNGVFFGPVCQAALAATDRGGYQRVLPGLKVAGSVGPAQGPVHILLGASVLGLHRNGITGNLRAEGV